jgi:Tetratricopeptide repeat
MKRVLISILFAAAAAFSCAAFALPTVNEVQAEVQKGNFAQAQSMMREVVDARPKSAKAHYIYAEILARNGKFDDASREAAQAKQLDPAIKFTQPDKFRSFQQAVNRAKQRADASPPASPTTSTATSTGTPTLSNLGPGTSQIAATPPVARDPVQTQAPPDRSPQLQAPPLSESRGSGIPGWLLPAGLVVLLFVGWRMMRRSQGSAGAMGSTAGGNYPANYGTPMGVPPNVGPMGGMASPGGGLLGTGLAAAGGVAAGMLAERFLERGREERSDGNLFDRNAQPGVSPGYSPSPDADARDLENRDVDFGNGQDWGGDDSSNGGGSLDVGNSGGNDDGGWS